MTTLRQHLNLALTSTIRMGKTFSEKPMNLTRYEEYTPCEMRARGQLMEQTTPEAPAQLPRPSDGLPGKSKPSSSDGSPSTRESVNGTAVLSVTCRSDGWCRIHLDTGLSTSTAPIICYQKDLLGYLNRRLPESPAVLLLLFAKQSPGQTFSYKFTTPLYSRFQLTALMTHLWRHLNKLSPSKSPTKAILSSSPGDSQ